jgi:hypothetical protein
MKSANKNKQKSPHNAKIKALIPHIHITERFKWLILCLLLMLIPLGFWSNFFAYGYHYFRCEAQPVEVDGEYYRLSIDNGYGIRPGSDYSHCGAPDGIKRDPRAKANVIYTKQHHDLHKMLTSQYDAYVPQGYDVSELPTDYLGTYSITRFLVKTKTNNQFQLSEMRSGADYDSTGLCNKPPTEHWSGTIIGVDKKGRQVCKTNIGKYVDDYRAGITIDRTAIILKTSGAPTEALNAEVIDIFSSMEQLPSQPGPFEQE